MPLIFSLSVKCNKKHDPSVLVQEGFIVIKSNYFTISSVPPAASIAALAFSLAAFTLKVSLVFSSPLANILTVSVWLINPFTYKFSKVNSVMAYFSAS